MFYLFAFLPSMADTVWYKKRPRSADRRPRPLRRDGQPRVHAPVRLNPKIYPERIRASRIRPVAREARCRSACRFLFSHTDIFISLISQRHQESGWAPQGRITRSYLCHETVDALLSVRYTSCIEPSFLMMPDAGSTWRRSGKRFALAYSPDRSQRGL